MSKYRTWRFGRTLKRGKNMDGSGTLNCTSNAWPKSGKAAHDPGTLLLAATLITPLNNSMECDEEGQRGERSPSPISLDPRPRPTPKTTLSLASRENDVACAMHQNDGRGTISPTQRMVAKRGLLSPSQGRLPLPPLLDLSSPSSPYVNSCARAWQTHLVPLDVSNVTCEGSVSPDLHGQVLQGQREDGRRAAPSAAGADDHIGRG